MSKEKLPGYEKDASYQAMQTQPPNPLTKKLNKILETRLDSDKESLEALKFLSTFFTENNLRTRRNLRSDIEKRSLSIHEEFCQAFKQVKDQVEIISSDVAAMNDCIQDMNSKLKKTKEQTRDLINQTTTLQNQSKQIQMKQEVACMFLDKFTLTAEEVQLLRGTREGQIQAGFFTALLRVKQIHSDCKILLRTKHQTAGLEIMEAMALYQEAAYERLYRWCQSECRLMINEIPDISPLLAQAMEALQDRPVLYRYSIDEYGTGRRTSVVKGFIDALTKGGSGGTPRPIELHSHDPLRYVGDMLAWLHQATASEKEYLHSLLKKVTLDKESVAGDVRQTLAHITDGVCRPLKMRVEQVVVSEPGAVILYKLTNLINFYHQTLSQVLTSASGLLATIEEMQDLSGRMFYASLNTHTAKLMDKVELPCGELKPPSSLQSTLQLLQDVLSSHDTSVTVSSSAPSGAGGTSGASEMLDISNKQHHFNKIIGTVVDPVIQMCQVSASRLPTVDMAVYMINSIHLIHSTLTLYEYTDDRLEMLQAQVEAHVDALCSEQASSILKQTSLSLLYSAVQQQRAGRLTGDSTPLAAQPDLDPISLRNAMVEFDKYLANIDDFMMPQCSLLISPTLRDTVVKRSSELMCSAYEEMYSMIHDGRSHYPDPANIMPRTPGQVRGLLLHV